MAFTSDNIKVFLKVLECGSFSAAARKLKRVPSAVSMTIAQLEAELDLVLFDRSGREPIPTEEAVALAPKARSLMNDLQQLNLHALEMHRGLEKSLTIAVIPELLSASWSVPLSILADEFPMLEVNVLTVPQEDALTLLHSGTVQLAVAFERPNVDHREQFQELSQEILIAVIAPSHPLYLVKKSKITQDDLINTRQIAVTSRQLKIEDRRLLISYTIWQTDNYHATLSLVKMGLGWAYLPKSLVKNQLETGELIQIEFTHMTNILKLWVDLIWSKNHALGMGAKRYIELMNPFTKKEVIKK